MKRGVLVMVVLALGSCATTEDLRYDASSLLAAGAPPADDDRVAICVATARFEADVYGRGAFFDGMREAFEENGFPLERYQKETREWVPAGSLPNRYRLVGCDSATGAGRMELVLGLSSPLFEQAVTTPWGGAYTLNGVRCQWRLDPAGVGDTLATGRCNVYYRGWSTRDGRVTAEMGRQFGEALLAVLHRRSGALRSDDRIPMPEVMVTEGWW